MIIGEVRYLVQQFRISGERLDRTLELLLGILLVYNNGSWIFFEASRIGGFSMLAILGMKLIRLSKQRQLARPNFLIGFLVVFPIFSGWMNSYGPINIPSIGLNAVFYLMLSFVPLRDLYRIVDRCARVVLFLMMVAALFGTLFVIHYDWIRLIPLSSHPGFNGGYYNFLIYTDRINNDLRVQSIFWEPGAWVFQMAFCLYWVVTVRKEWRWYPLFLWSFALALSTTGFILLGIHYLASIFSVRRIRTTISLLVGPPLVVLVLVLALPMIDKVTGLPLSFFAKEMVVGKFTGGKYSVSMDERKEATEKAAKIAAEHPLVGIGKQAEQNILYVTSSLSEYMYQFGYVFLVIFVFVVWRFYGEMAFPFSVAYVLIWLNGEALASGSLCSLTLIIGARKSAGRWFSRSPKSDPNLIAVREGPV